MIKKNQTIIGVDPGFGRIGWGIVREQNGCFSCLAHGCIETDATDSFVGRLVELHRELSKIVKKFHPDRAAVEDLFFFKNAKTAIKVGQARGVILLTLSENGIPIDEFTPLQVKEAVVGYGRAEKIQIQKMIRLRLSMKEAPKSDDAADALAIALTAAARAKYQ